MDSRVFGITTYLKHPQFVNTLGISAVNEKFGSNFKLIPTIKHIDLFYKVKGVPMVKCSISNPFLDICLTILNPTRQILKIVTIHI